MIDIVRTSSVSYAESVRLALESEGIPAVVSNGNLGGLPPAAITVAVVNDADYPEAVGVIRGLDPPVPATAVRMTGWKLFLLVVLGAALVTCGVMISY